MPLVSFWLKSISSAACLALLASCNQAGSSKTVSPSASQPATSTELSITPPSATLEINGKTQTAGLGSYCWQDSHEQQACNTIEGTPTDHEPLLAAETPFTGHFHLSLSNPPENLTLSMRLVLPYDDLTGGAGGTRLWRSTSGWAGEMPLKSDFEYEFMDSPSLYVISLAARWKDLGYVTYGFLVQVGPENTYLPTSTPGMAYAAATPQSLAELSPQTRLGKGGVQSLQISPDGRLLAISTALGVYMVKTSDQSQLWFRQFENKSVHLAFRPDGMQLAVGLTGSRMPIVDSQTGQTLMELSGEEGIHGVWSPDGKYILTSGQCKQVLVWEAPTAKVFLELQPAKCNGVTPGSVDAAWSWNGKYIYVTASPSGPMLAWDASTFQPLVGYKPQLPEHFWGAAPVPSPTGDWLALNNGNTISIMDGKTGGQVKLLSSDEVDRDLSDIHWSPDGKYLLAGNYLWEVASGKFLQKFGDLYKLAWLPDSKSLVGISIYGGKIRAFSISTGDPLFIVGGFHNYLAPYWEGSSLFTYDGSSVSRWDTTTGQVLDQTSMGEEPAAIKPANYSPDGSRWVDTDGSIKDARTRQEILQITPAPSHSLDVNAWSPDGSRIVSGDSLRQDPTVIWDAATGKVLFTLSLKAPGDLVLTCLAWSPDDAWVTAAGSLMSGSGFDDGMIALWDARTGAQAHLLMDAMSSERIQSIVWSHDGHWLAAGMGSGRIVLWDMQKFIPVANLSGHAGTINSLRWSPDDTLLASSSSDGTVLLWKIR
jgi:WD40 repeat protein